MTEDLFRHLRYFEEIANMTDMKKLETRQELLVITMEECGTYSPAKSTTQLNFMNTRTQKQNLKKRLVMYKL